MTNDLFNPDTIRWGLTTQNYLPHITVSLQSSKQLLDTASELGLTFVELRDPDASLTEDESRQLADSAKRLNINVNYSAQRGLLDKDLLEVLERAIVNTRLFEGPRVVRLLALRGEHPSGWTEQEFNTLVANSNLAFEMASGAGIGLAIENADSALLGISGEYYGMTCLMEAIHPEIKLQLDTANLFTGPVSVTSDEAAGFIEQFADRVTYLHLKSAQNGQAMPYLTDNPLSFQAIFNLLAEHDPLYVAIELVSGASFEETNANMLKSLEFLRDEGLFPNQ